MNSQIPWTIKYLGQSNTLDSQIPWTINNMDNQILWTIKYLGQSDTLDNQILWTIKYLGQSNTLDSQIPWTVKYLGQSDTLDNQITWTIKYLGQSNTLDKPRTSKTLQKKRSMCRRRAGWSCFEKKKILQDNFPYHSKTSSGPAHLTNNDLWLPNMVSYQTTDKQRTFKEENRGKC